MAFMEITLIPMGIESTSCSPYIARALDVAKNNPNIVSKLNSMGTVLEGSLPNLYQCLQDMQESLFDNGLQRVYTIVKIDDRRDKYQDMNQRIHSVEVKQHD